MARFTIGVLGMGKVGLPLAAYLTGLGHRVTGCEADEGRAQALRSGADVLPFEPGVRPPPGFGVFPQLGLRAALMDADLALICVPTPLEGYRLSSRLVRDAIGQVRAIDAKLPIAIISTLDPRDADEVCREGVVYNPPLIRLGHVREDLTNASMLLLGGEPELCRQVQDVWYPDRNKDSPGFISVSRLEDVPQGAPGDTRFVARRVRVWQDTPRTIAMAKLSINATLSARIAWANDVAAICQDQGIDAHQVLDIVGSDPRIGSAYMRPGAPPGGPCLPRDLEVWQGLANPDYHPMGTMATCVRDCHDLQMDRLEAEVAAQLGAMTPKPKKVAILGLTYVAGALDTTNSLGMALAKSLVGYFQVGVTDPAWGYLEKYPFPGVVFSGADAQAVVDWADAVVLCTPWPQFDRLNYVSPEGFGAKTVIDARQGRP